MSSVHKYKIYCTTESLWVEGWDTAVPTYCFNNNGHTINSSFTTQIDSISTTDVHIKEEKIPTNGNFRNKGYKFVCPVGNSNHDISFPIPVNIISVQYNILTENINDVIEVYGGHDTVVGTITADVSASATVIDVSSTVTDNALTGLNVALNDGTNKDLLGIIINVDKGAGQLTVETATTNSFLAATPTYVELTSNIVENVTLMTTGVYSMAHNKMEKNHLEADKVVRIKYCNNGGSSCDFYFYLSFMN